MPTLTLPPLEPALIGLLLLAGLTLAGGILTRLNRRLAARGHALAGLTLLTRNVLLAAAAALIVMTYFLGFAPNSASLKVIETFFWISVIWVSLSLLITGFFARASDSTWKSGVPSLFIDIVRLALAVVGAALVVAAVWNKDLGAFLATLGVGSIVLGLALQDTLGNLIAGIAVMFERPFYEGDWVQIGDTEGRVTEMNWRAVRLRTRALDMVVVPNSVLGKEKIHNFSRPTPLHMSTSLFSFSYSDPPNTVKSVLLRTAAQTRGVLSSPAPQVYTVGYGDSAINYQMRFYIDDYERMLAILDDFTTQVWYAARRGKISIPFPIRTVYKTEMPPIPAPDSYDEVRKALRLVPLFDALLDAEFDLLAQDSAAETFASGERILQQGNDGDSMYVIRSGSVVISAIDARGAEHEVARLGAGMFFGEMALLTGQSRSASVTAAEDCEVVIVRRDSLRPILEARPALAEELAKLVGVRRSGIEDAIKDQPPAERPKSDAEQERQLVARIKKFFGL
jgi:small-conductance mechanosensitive channel/CRP-like cAMP-binding protein